MFRSVPRMLKTPQYEGPSPCLRVVGATTGFKSGGAPLRRACGRGRQLGAASDEAIHDLPVRSNRHASARSAPQEAGSDLRGRADR